MNYEKMFHKFNDDRANDLVKKIYSEKDNYEIVKTNGRKGRVLIFFTGHGLYYPNTYDSFYKSVVVDNKFEWKKLASNPRVASLAEEIIFVRDVYKVWCINGINATLNSQNKLAEFLKEIVGKREVVTIGSSAGGYMAILFGCYLKAVTIYAFSPQVNLHEYHKDHIIDCYDEYISNSYILNNMDLKPLIESYSGDLLYWYPAKCEEDIRQQASVSTCSNIAFFALDQTEHGATLWGESIIRTLELKTEKIKQLSMKHYGEIVTPMEYCSETSGFVKALGIFIVKKIKNKR